MHDVNEDVHVGWPELESRPARKMLGMLVEWSGTLRVNRGRHVCVYGWVYIKSGGWREFVGNMGDSSRPYKYNACLWSERTPCTLYEHHRLLSP